MKQYSLAGACFTADFEKGTLRDYNLCGTEISSGNSPMFRVGLRDESGRQIVYAPGDAQKCAETKNGAVYSGFPSEITVKVTAVPEADGLDWRISVENRTSHLVEWVDFPLISLPKPVKGKSGILTPYNEGAIVEDLAQRERTLPHCEPVYPSHGSYYMFPNMICSQFMAYLFTGTDGEQHGLYIGAHDAERGVKAVDFYPEGDSVVLQFRVFCGIRFGESYSMPYSIVMRTFDGGWEAAAEIYRVWFEENLPPRAMKIRERTSLPDWYHDLPLIVSYPVRGIHDMDKMDPNRLFPYANALPLIDEFAEKTGARIMVLLMHWEGTAPWAPPYVWPPFGGEECLGEFMKALHERGNLLGVYCSGFGYTIQSNLIAGYNKQDEYERRGLESAMCVSPEGRVEYSRICPGQRSGYDLCPASDAARTVLEEAYGPLLSSEIDYVQILDQNHGGSQYFCYSKEHGHPHGPGAWMTENMQELLSSWNGIADASGTPKLFGCESAAAEPFIGNLLFSDNRYELCWHIGRPVPLYAYLYHEYLHNFMGNQGSCPFPAEEDTLRCRIAYSFSAGDCMTVVLNSDGDFLANWGGRDFTHLPDQEKTLALIRNLTRFYREQAKQYLSLGKMVAPGPVECGGIVFHADGVETEVPEIYSTAWECDGKSAQILVNHTDHDVVCRVNGREIRVPALDAVLTEM